MAPAVPVEITNQKIAKLRDWMNQYLEAEMPDGSIDLDKAQRNINYSAGNFYTNLNGLYLQEDLKRAQIESDLNHLKALKYDEVKRFTDYPIEKDGVSILIAGSENVRKKQLEYDKQVAYLAFLERALKQFGFYSNKVDVMIRAKEFDFKYG